MSIENLPPLLRECASSRSSAELARSADGSTWVDASAIRHWLNGTRRPTESHLRQFLEETRPSPQLRLRVQAAFRGVTTSQLLRELGISLPITDAA